LASFNEYILTMRIGLYLLIFLLLQVSVVQACPKRLPDGLVGTPVGQNTVVNGMTLTITQVETKKPPAEILERTAKTWLADGFDVKRNMAAGWDTVAAISKDCLATLQFSKTSGAMGYFTVGYPKPAVVITPATFGMTLPVDMKVLSSVESLDSGRRGLTLAMTSKRSLQQLTQQMAEDLVRQGWTGVRPFGVMNAETGKTSQSISAQKGRHQVQIVMWPEAETKIVMTIAEGL
jgi:hypothetical protein